MGQHAALYATAEWKRKRKAQITANPLCVYCEALGIVKAAKVADHITPHRGAADLFYGGALQSLCWTCHSGPKQRLENGGGLIGGDTLGYPVDPSHFWNS